MYVTPTKIKQCFTVNPEITYCKMMQILTMLWKLIQVKLDKYSVVFFKQKICDVNLVTNVL